MEGQKNGENGKKISRVVRLTLHNTGLHITRSPDCRAGKQGSSAFSHWGGASQVHKNGELPARLAGPPLAGTICFLRDAGKIPFGLHSLYRDASATIGSRGPAGAMVLEQCSRPYCPQRRWSGQGITSSGYGWGRLEGLSSKSRVGQAWGENLAQARADRTTLGAYGIYRDARGEDRSAFEAEKAWPQTSKTQIGMVSPESCPRNRLPGTDPVRKVSIIPRAVAALGYTLQVPTEDRFLMAKSELLNKIAVALGGRAAEEIKFGDISTGAHNDLARATDVARSMAKEYGMSLQLGHIYFEKERRKQYLLDMGLVPQKNYSEKTAEVIDHEIKAIMDQQYQVAMKILTGYEKVLDEGAALVLKEENIEGDRLKKLLETEKAD